VFVVAVVIVALGRERRAIREELAGESETGAVTREELNVLKSFVAQRSRYAGAFIREDFDGWLAMRELHNRQVQLALAKSRAPRDSDPESQAASEAEVESLRAAVLEMKHGTGATKQPGRRGPIQRPAKPDRPLRDDRTRQPHYSASTSPSHRHGSGYARIQHDGILEGVAFSPDGEFLATTSADKTARVGAWRGDGLAEEACSRVTRNPTREEWERYALGWFYDETCENLPGPEEQE